MDAIQQLNPGVDEDLQRYVDQGMSYSGISKILTTTYGNLRGLSSRSVRRYCKTNGIGKKKGRELDEVVSQCASEVGCSYGRKMMKGHLLASRGLKLSEAQISASLQRVSPYNFQLRRTNTISRTNPIRYVANYFGHKLHVDQNEKLTSFGVTHVVARDGYSGMIVSHITLPVKNNVAIYEGIFKTAIENHGVWDQIRVDHGREFYLLLYMQEKIRSSVGSASVTSYVQSKSTENLTIERIWPEVNHRVNYPIKQKLVEMENTNIIDMSCSLTKFCVSYVAIQVATNGLERFVEAWNHHPIRGGGTPLQKAAERIGVATMQSSLPSGEQARQEYIIQGGSITPFGFFGVDPLEERQDLIIRRDGFIESKYGSYATVFTDIISNNGDLFVECITDFLQRTKQLQQLL